jgi:short-chain fatty acids transporter
MFIGLIILNASMHPAPEDTFCIDPKLIEADEKRQAAEAELEKLDKKNMTPAERLENSKLITYLVSIAGIAYIVWYFGTKGFSMNIDIMNFMLFIFGILLNRTPIAYVRQLGNAVKNRANLSVLFSSVLRTVSFRIASLIFSAISIIDSVPSKHSLMVVSGESMCSSGCMVKLTQILGLA